MTIRAASHFQPTAEQDAVLAAYKTNQSLIITAGAGTGKTSTLKLLAADGHAAGRKGIYLAFNKSVATEAARDFPSSVDCRTVHSIAFQAVGKPYSHRMRTRTMSPSHQAAHFGIRGRFAFRDIELSPSKQMMLVSGVLKKFSKDLTPQVEIEHVDLPPNVHFGLDAAHRLALRTLLRDTARKAWLDIIDPTGTVMYFTDDYYLKLWALGSPTLNADYLMLDEGQDTDPVVAAVFAAQTHAQQIVVGDENQAIYGWRGAISFMSDFQAVHRAQLSQSFRFGQEIADEANVWLDVIGGPLRLTGNPMKTSRIGGDAAPDACLYRSNVGAFEGFVLACQDGRKAALAGGGTEIKKFAEEAIKLKERGFSSHPDLIGFSTWADAQDYVENDPYGADIATQVKLVDRFGAKEMIEAIEAGVGVRSADVICTTAHKAKGGEFDSVLIGDDFFPPKDDEAGHPNEVAKSEAMLAYVAVTRAKKILNNDGLRWIHQHMLRLGHVHIPTPPLPMPVVVAPVVVAKPAMKRHPVGYDDFALDLCV